MRNRAGRIILLATRQLLVLILEFAFAVHFNRNAIPKHPIIAAKIDVDTRLQSVLLLFLIEICHDSSLLAGGLLLVLLLGCVFLTPSCVQFLFDLLVSLGLILLSPLHRARNGTTLLLRMIGNEVTPALRAGVFGSPGIAVQK